MIVLRCGQAEELLATLTDASVAAIVTDPPAGIGFMGMGWDHHKGGRDRWIQWLAGIMAQCLRVAKPGAHALVWALPRTSHWTATAMEDAGWIVEDRIAHVFGQGFPKNKSKLKPAVEDWWLCTKPGGAKWLNVDGCRVGAPDGVPLFSHRSEPSKNCYADGKNGSNRTGEIDKKTGRWPSNLLLTHHPDCVSCGERRVKGSNPPGPAPATRQTTEDWRFNGHQSFSYADPEGRETVPAWQCVAGCPVAMLDEQSGERTSGLLTPDHRRSTPKGWSGPFADDNEGPAARGTFGGDSGGASRFFPTFAWTEADFASFHYQSKASRAERERGLLGFLPCVKCGGIDSLVHLDEKGRPVRCHRNHHPTVKPLALMRHLTRLVTPPGGTILDPFCGTGTTLLAARAEGFDAIGFDQEPDHVAIAERRLAVAGGVAS